MKLVLKPIFTAIAASVMLSACNLAPKTVMPSVDIPSSFQYDLHRDEMAIQAVSLGWKDYFADPRLHQLIDLAIKNNTDLRTANLNVEQVRAQYEIQRSTQLPSLGSTATANRNGNAAGVANGYSIGLGVTAFELDLWGRVRNSSEAVLNTYFASAASRDATHLSIVSAVAKAYFNERFAEESMVLAERVLKSRQETYRLSVLKHRSGVISAVDLREQEAVIEQARTAYTNAVRAREQARNALTLLISQVLPQDLPEPLPLSQQLAVHVLPAGLSSQLLLNRPDIRVAEYDLKRADANIGVARASFFPTISLTGRAGWNSAELDNLFDGGQKFWSFGPSVSLPLFDWGNRKANLEAVKVARDKAVVAYESVVESAFRDVSDALVTRAALDRQYQSNVAQRSAYNDRLRLIKLRYQHGVSSSLDLLDAERSSFNAENMVLATQLSMMENFADVYKALGGGLKRLTEDDKQIQQQLNDLPN